MKHCKLLMLFLLPALILQAQTNTYNVVFDLTSKDTNAHKSVLRWMNAISKEHPDAQMEVVLYGQSLDMVQKEKSSVTQQLQEVTANKNLSVKVCAAAMKRHGVERTALLPNVDVVPDGIYEIVSKQRQGWGYIKVAQ
ncbi:MAG TPA: DsrE family protein [Flavisolibacter sp.]|nr:DsrE family protein [Flavisolibacter sp.]